MSKTEKNILYWSNGQKKEEGNYKNGKRDGEWTYWYENGQKMGEETYKDGEVDGIVIIWHRNGQKQREYNYKDGGRDGLEKRWYEDGQKKIEGTWKDNKRDGLFTSWYENGQKRYEETWKDGKLANQVKESIDYRNEVKVDRTDAKSTAGALLRAYKEQDLRTIATLSTKSDHDFIIEMANSGDSHNHYRNFMEVNFSGWREEGVQAWNGQLEEVRYKQSRTKIRASVKFGELGPEEFLVVKLKWEDGKWCALQIENLSPDMFLEWGLEKPKIPKDL